MKLETVGSSPILHPMNTPIVMHDSVFGDGVTIIVCDGCHTECSTCEYRFFCYTTGNKFSTREEISNEIKKSYSIFIKTQEIGI